MLNNGILGKYGSRDTNETLMIYLHPLERCKIQLKFVFTTVENFPEKGEKVVLVTE